MKVAHLAEPCPRWFKQAWIDWLGPDVIWELYAGTEGQAITVLDGHDWLTHRARSAAHQRGDPHL